MGLEQLTLETGLNKVEFAIDLLKAWEPPEGYYLAFSGGKDSVAIYDLAVKAGVKFDAHYCVSPIDPPQIYKFIKEHYPDVIWDYHAKGFWKMVDNKGLPTRQDRWCCQIIKEAGGKGRVVVVGNRRTESHNRSKQCFTGQGIGSNKTKFFVRPIMEFSNSDIWQYMRENHLPCCELYDQGFERLGCIMCPLGKNPEYEALRFPKIDTLWRRACDHLVEAEKSRGYLGKKGKPLKYQFKTGEEKRQWWVKRK
jgi:phosphoadenosine phosphosulfate reductase